MTAIRTLRLTVCAILVTAFSALAAGPRTHAEMGQRAWDQYILAAPDMLPGLAEFRPDAEAMRAFYSGCTFPDFGYNGINEDAAEYAHWYPYQQAYLAHLLETYPPPWNEAARREVAFFLGILCHGVGDIPWHFDEDGHKSLLTMARENDNAGHGFTEHITDLFSHVLFELEPEPRGRFVWPVETARTVFERADVAVTRDELVRGCDKLEGQWLRGARLGPVAYPYFQAKIPWCRAHYEDYYYGGVEHGAALTAMCINYYYARLNGWRYYQNIPIQASAFPHGEPYLPCEDGVIPELAEGTGGATLSVGPNARAWLRFDVSDIASAKTIERATLWLRRVDEPVSGAVEIAVYGQRGEDADDREPSPEALERIDGASPMWVAWDVTSIAGEWVRGLRPNLGLLLEARAMPEGGGAAAIRFYSSEALQARPDGYGGTVVAFRPVLVVR